MKLEDTMQPVGSFADGRILAGRIDNIGVLLFNYPERRNAINVEMWDGVAQTLALFTADDTIRVVIYAGTGGKAFVSGGDISEFASRRPDAKASAEFDRALGTGRASLCGFAKPSIACLQGYTLGGGLAIAVEADLRVAADDSQLGVPAARLGIGYEIRALTRLVSLIGQSRTRLMLYSARRLRGVEALDVGLVDMIAPADKVVEETVALARTIADNAPLAVSAAKFTIDQIVKDAADRDLAGVAEFGRRCSDSADYKEGYSAFMAKRKPVFTGR